MSDVDPAVLAKVVDSVLASRKYALIAPQVVHTIAAAELAKGRKWKGAVKATKNKLHQSASVYQQGRMQYDEWLERLEQHYDSPDRFQAACRQIMPHHASTRERLPILDSFYPTIFAGLPPVQSILDLACGLNPLTLSWMSSGTPIRYRAYDIYADQIGFLNRFFDIVSATDKVDGRAEFWNLLDGPPPVAADVALLLKTIPCLEQVDKSVGPRLLETIDAGILIVSFPAQSLGGQGKGMVAYYEAHFRRMVQGKPWQIERFLFATELVFRIDKRVPNDSHNDQ